MKRRGIILSSVLVLGLVLAACGSGSDSGHVALGANAAQAATADPEKAAELKEGMRKLWEDHIAWTRLFIVSAAAGLPDTDATAGRLLRNQDDIGNAIKPYYGEEAGTALTKLLREHILIAADILTAAKSGEDAKVQKSSKAWYRNADDIAAFLAKANPDNWPRDAVSAHMKMHLDLTLEEAVARLQGEFEKDIAAYDKIHDAILELSDALAAGIVAQFPEKFA